MPIVRILDISVAYFDATKGQHVHLERHSLADVPDDVAPELIACRRAVLADEPAPSGPDFSTQPPAPVQLPPLSVAQRACESVGSLFGIGASREQ